MKCLHQGGAALLLAAGLWLLAPPAPRAADHRDSAGPSAFPAADITDLYVFRSPADSSHLVLALNVYPRRPSDPAPTSYFSNNVRYVIHMISCTASPNTVTPDVNLTFTFSGSGAAQTFTLSGLTLASITGTVKQVATAASGKARVYCGPRDDSFFFDQAAFDHFLASPHPVTDGLRNAADDSLELRPPVRNAYEGSDVSSIVVEYPILNVAGCGKYSGKLKAWAETQKITGTTSKPSLLVPVR
jgi:hypothetical protein